MELNKLKHLFKRNAYFTITLIVLLLSVTFAGITLAVFSIGNTVDQTSIGFIYLGSYDQDRYESVLNNEINIWKVNAEYKIQYQDYSYIIPLDLVDFNYNQTLDHLVKDQDNLAYFDVTSGNMTILENEIEQQFTSSINNQFNFDQFYQDFHQDIQNLKDRKTYELSDYLESSIETSILAQKNLLNINAADVDSIIGEVTNVTIYANERFSLLNQLGSLDLTNEQLSIIASGIQGVIIDTNFSGFIFEQNYTEPLWAITGQNVRVLRVNNFDFTFFNDFTFNYLVTISKVNATTLSFTLTGYPYITDYQTASEFQVAIPFPTIYIDNPDIDDLSPGVIITETDTEYIYHVLIQSGVDGQVVFFMRTTTRLGEASEESRLFSEQVLSITAIYYENIVEKGGI